jgi:hypothetical protein
VTFKDLQRLVESQSQSRTVLNQLQRLRNRAFWYWDQNRHEEKDRASKGDCCFNHIIGLPRKDGIEKPLFDYEKLLYRALLVPGCLNSDPSLRQSDPNNVKHAFKEKHLWVKKATGLGVTEFMLKKTTVDIS